MGRRVCLHGLRGIRGERDDPHALGDEVVMMLLELAELLSAIGSEKSTQEHDEDRCHSPYLGASKRLAVVARRSEVRKRGIHIVTSEPKSSPRGIPGKSAKGLQSGNDAIITSGYRP